jgi:hypothetical protein
MDAGKYAPHRAIVDAAPAMYSARTSMREDAGT